MLGILLSVIIQLAIVVPAVLLYKKNSEQYKDNSVFSKCVLWVFCIFFIFWGAVSLGRFYNVSGGIYIPISNRLIAAAIIVLICFYAAWLGIKALARSSVITVAILVISLILLILGAFQETNILNLTPDRNSYGVFHYMFYELTQSGELPAMFILAAITQSKTKTAVFSFLAAKLFICELIAVICIIVLGNLMPYSEFPFFKTAAYAQPFSVQRAESVYLVLFSFLCIICISSQLLISSLLLKKLIPKFKYPLILSSVAMLIVFAFSYTTSVVLTITGTAALVITFVAPIILYVKSITHKEAKSNG